MAKIDIKNLSGDKVGSLDLDDAVWGADVNEHLLWEVVKWQGAKRRRGTHSSLTVAEVHGTRKKPFRQKGTGNARRGSMKAHHHVGGGRAFGPKPRDYEYDLPKKVRKGALRSALSLRAKEQKVIVLDAFALTEAKTKRVVEVLAKLGGKKCLIVDAASNVSLARAGKNLQSAKVLPPEGLNVRDVLAHETLIITADSARQVEKTLKPAARAAKEE